MLKRIEEGRQRVSGDWFDHYSGDGYGDGLDVPYGCGESGGLDEDDEYGDDDEACCIDGDGESTGDL